LELVNMRWRLVTNIVVVDYENSVGDAVGDLGDHMGKVFGFVAENLQRETRTDPATGTTTRAATLSWEPQLCESLYVRAPNIVASDELIV
jgi:hypothetical protein